MSSKKFNIIEKYADKIILAVVGLLAISLLWAFVITGPNTAKLDNRNFGPGQIDPYIKKQADRIKEKSEESATPKIYDKNKVAQFEEKLRCSIQDVPTSVYFPLPGTGQAIDTAEERQYAAPAIPPLDKPAIAAYRAAARMPTQDVTPEMNYKTVQGEPADLDIVSVSARVNIQTLVQNFQQSFMGPRLNAKWRDPSLAEPVFARIELQRKTVNPDGSPSDWQTVPLARIDSYRQFQSELPLTTEQLTYGAVDLFITQYKNTEVTMSILQPLWYDFIVADSQWLAPEYRALYLQSLERQESLRIRELRETRLKERTAPTAGGAAPRTRETRTARPTESPDMLTTPVRPAKQEKKPEDILKDWEGQLLTDKTDILKLRDPLLIWAHDDTVKPDNKYQYRIRYGLFNPIAGKNWFLPEYKQYKNQIVLWSPFTEIPDVVYIPKMTHVFPTELLADGSLGLKVEICKYHLGYWRNHEFQVFAGQTIGKPAESSAQSPTAANPETMMMNTGLDQTAGAAGTEKPETIDYTTDWIMVDIVQTADWAQRTGTARRSYAEMLYTTDGLALLTVPVGKQNWPKEMRKDYDDIKQAQQKELTPVEMRQTRPGGTDTMRDMPPEMMMPGF